MMAEREWSQDIQNVRINESAKQRAYDNKGQESPSIFNKAQLTPEGIWEWALLILVVAMLIVIVVLVGVNGMETSLNEDQNQIIAKQPLLNISQPIWPPILWILTARDINNSRLEPTFYGHHLQYVAKKSGFEPRFVDHESAYQWLSDPVKNIITKAMHRRKYDVSVEDFLRLALIIEHGGINLILGDVIFIEELDWLRNIFQNPNSKQNEDYQLQCPLNSSAELFTFKGKGFYTDLFIAGKKNSSILWTIFLQMAEAVEKGSPSLKQIEQINGDTKAIYLKKPFQFLLKSHLPEENELACQKWGFQSIDVNILNRFHSCRKDLTLFLKESDRSPLMKECRLKFMINIQGGGQPMRNMFNRALQNGPSSIENYHKNSLIGEYFLQLKPLQKYLKPIDQVRDVQFCIVSLKTVPRLSARKSIQESLGKISMQTSSKWNAVYFVEEEIEAETLSRELNATVLTASIYEGLNLQTAVTQHCAHHSIVFLLDFDESFTSYDNLEQASNIFSERSVYAALVPLEINSSRRDPPQMKNIRRAQFNPNVENLNTITNHLRVFNSDYYSIISHTDLHNVEGEYFDRAIPFLAMLEMALDLGRCYRTDQTFEIKRMRLKIDFPQKRTVLPFTIRTKTFKTVDSRRPEFNTKFNYLPFCSPLQLKNNNDNWLWNGDEILVRNLGVKYQGPKDRRQMRKIIPRKIHFIWIQGQISSAKKYIMNQMKRLHPEFQTFLWSKANITKDNFPYTYDILQTLLYFQEAGSYLKYASLADIMRMQIVYQKGGFYFDTNHLWLDKGSLEDWRTYELLLGGQFYPRVFIITANTPFASYPKNPRLLCLLKPEALNRVRIFDQAASICTGPGYTRHLVNGQIDEGDVNILRPSVQQLIPYYPWNGMTRMNYCMKVINEESADFALIDKGLWLHKNCSKFYPSSYAIDLFDLGGSWKRKK